MVEAYCIEQATQKTRKVTKAKVWEEAEKKKYIEKKEKRKQLEYLEKLWNKILAKDITLMAGTENLQIVETKYKKIVNISLEDEIEL